MKNKREGWRKEWLGGKRRGIVQSRQMSGSPTFCLSPCPMALPDYTAIGWIILACLSSPLRLLYGLGLCIPTLQNRVAVSFAKNSSGVGSTGELVPGCLSLSKQNTQKKKRKKNMSFIFFSFSSFFCHFARSRPHRSDGMEERRRMESEEANSFDKPLNFRAVRTTFAYGRWPKGVGLSYLSLPWMFNYRKLSVWKGFSRRDKLDCRSSKNQGGERITLDSIEHRSSFPCHCLICISLHVVQTKKNRIERRAGIWTT